ncbi:MAG: hypothetical protein IT444_04095 [Phycisphaeraceae bacterium]|nr:hypothetical protein [Phycisphaeraceae bacterium]
MATSVETSSSEETRKPLSTGDKELELYRNLMPVPDHFEDGFGIKTVIGALFLGFIMVPGSIYLSLFVGTGLGPAAQWVTVILFSEIVKRSMKSLRQQEIMVLFYMTGITVGGAGGAAQGLLWNQYFVRSPEAISFGVASEVPKWVAPAAEYIDLYGRTFFTPYWVIPILFMVGMMLISRIDQFGLGYALYRITAHVEKLPFPMAPAGAMAVTALAETRESSQRWRWRCFSLGGVLGMAFGLIYLGVPAITGALFADRVTIIPIPWLDLGKSMSTESFLPAVPINLVFDLTLVVTGFVVPFWAAVGGFLAFLSTVLINPMLRSNGMLPTWREGMGVVDTNFSNMLDFYLSFGIGLMLAIFIVSVIPMLKPMLRVFSGSPKPVKRERLSWGSVWRVLRDRSRERGDLSILTSLSIYVFSTFTYIGVCLLMMPGTAANNYQDRFPAGFFLLFGFVYQPIISYINAKLAGIVGMSVSIPLVREASFILSGYKGATIWFAPIPLNDYGGAASVFRAVELTGTKTSSLIKTEIVVFPILIITTVLFSEVIWRMAAIPGPSYPYTQEFWRANALQFSLTATSTLSGTSAFLESIKFNIIGIGSAIGLTAFLFLRFLNAPLFLVYGFVAGLGQTTPGSVIPILIGALLSRFYFEPKFGQEKFKRYAMILLPGFAAGVGLVGMAAVAINLIAKSTTTLGY